MKGHIAFVLIIVITCSIAAAGMAHGAEGTAVLKVGTFDSRAVALAYWRSAEGMQKTGALHREMKEAKEKGDEERVKELEIEGPGLQVRMHQQVFSTGSVTDVIKLIQDRLPAIASEAGVVIIVPKWNVAWQGDGVEVIDLTDQLVRCFKPSEQILKMIGQMDEQPPVPIEELSMDPKH